MDRVLKVLDEAENDKRRFAVKTPDPCLKRKLAVMRRVAEVLAKEFPHNLHEPVHGEAPFTCDLTMALLALGIFGLRSLDVSGRCDPIDKAGEIASELVAALELSTGLTW